ncbi:MAG TPA: hypothetical protein VMV92_17940 [Streptosporangiaceae bacterium]|nr:hypothetical protein [Streptosporangiaceae bacterium]
MTGVTVKLVDPGHADDAVPPPGTAIVRAQGHVRAVRERYLQRFADPAEAAASRSARAWAWALGETTTAPVSDRETVSPPARSDIETEIAIADERRLRGDRQDRADAAAIILRWLIGVDDHVPVRCANPGELVGGFGDILRSREEMTDVLSAADEGRHRAAVESLDINADPDVRRRAQQDAEYLDGVMATLAWVLGERAETPVTRARPRELTARALKSERVHAEDVIEQGGNRWAADWPLPRWYGQGVKSTITWLLGDSTALPVDPAGNGHYGATGEVWAASEICPLAVMESRLPPPRGLIVWEPRAEWENDSNHHPTPERNRVPLDLSTSHAKIDRAFEHLEVLEAEIPGSVPQEGAYLIRFSEIDQQTGWCNVVLVPNHAKKPLLGVVFGDVIHNLRCALDYIVTGLADASRVELTAKHQFPIFTHRQDYEDKVGTDQTAKPNGPLAGITCGLGEVEQFQPYHRQPDPREDPLWHIHRFSNADKHREVAGFLVIPGGDVRVVFPPGVIAAERKLIPKIMDWSPDKEYVIRSIRFDPPYPDPRDFRIEAHVGVGTGFSTSAFSGKPEHAVHIYKLRESCDHIRLIVNTFERV